MRQVGCVGVHGQPYFYVCWHMRLCPMSEFYVVFTSVLVLISSMRWYIQNIVWTIFIFEQISNTNMNNALIPIVGGLMMFMIIIHWRLSTQTQCLTWFDKQLTFMERSILLEIEKGHTFTHLQRRRIINSYLSLIHSCTRQQGYCH